MCAQRRIQTHTEARRPHKAHGQPAAARLTIPGPPATPPDGPSGHRAWPRPAVSPPGDDGGRRSRTALTNMSGGADGCVRCGRWTRAQRGRPLFHLAGPASPCRFALRRRARHAPPRPAPLRCHAGARHGGAPHPASLPHRFAPPRCPAPGAPPRRTR
jgi:hypothetical protein